MSGFFENLKNRSLKSDGVEGLRSELPLNSYYPMQEGASIHADAIASVDGIRAVVDRAGNVCVAKGVRIMRLTGGDATNLDTTTTTTGTPPTTTTAGPASAVSSGSLVVHLYGDYNAAGEKQYTRYDFEAGDKEGFLFDEIRDSETTINLADVKVLL